MTTTLATSAGVSAITMILLGIVIWTTFYQFGYANTYWSPDFSGEIVCHTDLNVTNVTIVHAMTVNSTFCPNKTLAYYPDCDSFSSDCFDFNQTIANGGFLNCSVNEPCTQFTPFRSFYSQKVFYVVVIVLEFIIELFLILWIVLLFLRHRRQKRLEQRFLISPPDYPPPSSYLS
jgi:hypothetical protein